MINTNKTQTDEVEQTKNTYSKICQAYARSNTSLNPQVQTMLDKFISLVPGKKVIDIGCAHGRESKYLSDHGLEVTGCDSSPGFIKLAKKNCPKCKFIVSDMRSLPRSLHNFDGAWVNASFLHIPKEAALSTLKGFKRVLKNRGTLYISVMEGNFNSMRENKQMGWPARHFSDYSKVELKHLLSTAGFNVLSKQKNQTSWGPVFLHFFCLKPNKNP